MSKKQSSLIFLPETKESREYMKEYSAIIIPFTAAMTCQFLKFIIEFIKTKKIRISRLLNGNGGVPSTHTTLVFSLVFTLLCTEGVKSPLFAISLILATVVSYDAMGVRLQTEKQAEVINQLMDTLLNKNKKQKYKHLKEELGHEPFEVAFGILFAFVFTKIALFLFL